MDDGKHWTYTYWPGTNNGIVHVRLGEITKTLNVIEKITLRFVEDHLRGMMRNWFWNKRITQQQQNAFQQLTIHSSSWHPPKNSFLPSHFREQKLSKKFNRNYHHSIKIKWILRWHWSSLASGQITLISLMGLSYTYVSHKTVKTEERCVFSFIIPTINTTPVERAIKDVI